MSIEDRDMKYAHLIATKAISLHRGDWVVVSAPVSCSAFVRLVVKNAYDAGAGKVIVDWYDDTLTELALQHESLESIAHVFQGDIARRHEWLSRGASHISITSPWTADFSTTSALARATRDKTIRMAYREYYDHLMKNASPWTVVSYPNTSWAKKMYPYLSDKEALKALHDAILNASRIGETPEEEWDRQVKKLEGRAKALNALSLVSLTLSTGLGTHLVVPLAQGAIWKGGSEETVDGRHFLANIPTEEVFTMPHRSGANGVVVASRPLDLGGVLVEDFSFTFAQGEVISFTARKGYDALASLLDTDEGIRHLGELALIGEDTPIAESGLLYYNTLFDENASSHLALGAAYSMNLAGASEMSEEEQCACGMNSSLDHVDFMYGTSDLSIDGETKDGRIVPIFRDGKFCEEIS